MPILIRSKRDGFRRCGIAHSVDEIAYPDDRFTAEELKRLQKEPMIIVRIVKTIEPQDKPPVKQAHVKGGKK
jgi:hypothetical protein